LVALGGCDGVGIPLQPEDQATGDVSVAIRVGKVAAASISRAEIVVTATGITEMRQPLTISGSTITGTVRGIPAGAGRLFTLNGYDASGALTYTGSATATIVAGQVAQVQIPVRSTAGTGTPVITIGATSARPYADTTPIDGTVANLGTADATGVTIGFRAKNRAGEIIGDATAEVGSLRAGESKVYTTTFEHTGSSSLDARHVATVDYTIRYIEGGPVTGTIEL
jgi:hypothetical protein